MATINYAPRQIIREPFGGRYPRLIIYNEDLVRYRAIRHKRNAIQADFAEVNGDGFAGHKRLLECVHASGAHSRHQKVLSILQLNVGHDLIPLFYSDGHRKISHESN